MAGRSKEETQGVTLLGNQGTKYPLPDYRSAGLCSNYNFVCAGCKNGRE